MDVDGTLTDGKVYIGTNGELFKAFNIKDGLGINTLLKHHNIEPAIITGRNSAMVLQRCSELGIKALFQGVSDKVACLKVLIKKKSLVPSEVAYIGDDLNDIAVMKLCGLKGCPADAADEVKSICDFIAPHNGGDGAVRDFIEYIISRYNYTSN